MKNGSRIRRPARRASRRTPFHPAARARALAARLVAKAQGFEDGTAGAVDVTGMSSAAFLRLLRGPLKPRRPVRAAKPKRRR